MVFFSSFVYLKILIICALGVFGSCFCIRLCCEYFWHTYCQTDEETDEDVFLICWCLFFSCSTL